MAGLLVAQDDSKKDVVDAEFTEADFSPQGIEAEFIELHDPPPPKRRWPYIVAGLVVIGFGYWMFHHPRKEDAVLNWPAGWAELIDCAYLVSFDGTKELDLYETQAATLYDKTNRQKNGKFSKFDGTWSLNEPTKQYNLTLDGQTTTYALIDPDGIQACMLVKGSLDAADLRSSWFSRIPQQDDASDEPSEMEAKAR